MRHTTEPEPAPASTWLFGFPDEISALPFGAYLQSYTRRMQDLNDELSRFVGERIDHNGAICQAFAHCDSLPKALEIEGDWLRVTVEDYFNESRRLIEINGELFGGVFGPAGKVAESATKPDGSAEAPAAQP